MRPSIVVADSVTTLDARRADAVLVSGSHGGLIGSHGGLHGSDPESALSVDAYAAFFHDAGRGKEDAGLTRLPVLARRGVPAGTVDYRTARIGDARSMWTRGALSCVNDLLGACAVQPGMSLPEAVARLRNET